MAFDLSQHMSMSKLIRFTLPTIFMMIFTSLYTIVDGIFVSNFAGKTAFAAVNFILPFCMILASVGMMIGTGGSAIVAKTLGEGDHPRARRYFTLLVIFAGVIGTALAIMGIFFMEDMAGFLGAEGAMLEAATLYGIFMMFSLPFFVLQYAFQSFFVTAGQPKLGFYVIVIAGVTNIVLDFLFVGVFQWGLIGAAIATNIGEVLGGGIPLIYFMKKRASHLYFVKPHLRLKVIGKACVNGSSEMVTNIAMSFVSMLYIWQLLHYIGEDGVAAYGVIMYTAMIFAAIFMGYSVGASPLMSFQYGAKNHKEMRSLLMKSLGLITCLVVHVPRWTSIRRAYIEDLRGLRHLFARPYRICLQDICALLLVHGLFDIRIVPVHRTQQWACFGAHLVFAHTRVRNRSGYHSAAHLRHRRHLVLRNRR